MAIDYNEQFTGIVEAIGIFPIKESIKNQMVPSGEYKGEQFNLDKTHTVAFKIPELHKQWITIGHRKFNEGYDLAFSVKKGDEYVNVWNGSKITFMYARSGNFINIEAKSIRVLNFAPCEQKVYTFGEKKGGGDSGSQGTAASYDSVGMLKGNATNGALILVDYKKDSPSFVRFALNLKSINEELKKEIPGVAGAAIGMAILNACRGTMDVNKVKAYAKGLLQEQCAELDRVWDAGIVEPEKPAASKPTKSEPTALSEEEMEDLPF